MSKLCSVRFRIEFSFPFLAAVERRNGAVVVTMVSIGLENAGRYLPDVPERIIAVGVTTCLDTCLDLGHGSLQFDLSFMLLPIRAHCLVRYRKTGRDRILLAI